MTPWSTKKIDTEGLDFEIRLEDVQSLNEGAINGRLDISKISYGVLPLIMTTMNCWKQAARWEKVSAPLLIAKNAISLNAIRDCTIAVPGFNTTAHLLFSWAFPEAHKKKFVVFSEIEDMVLNGITDCGVIIHENRFTYSQKGLVNWWTWELIGKKKPAALSR